ncbi:hypothetical protein PMIN03_005472 [Paraphaeosphaeria minitans]
MPPCHSIWACIATTSFGGTHKLLSLAPASRSTYTGVRASSQRSFTHTVDQFPISGPTCDSGQRMGRLKAAAYLLQKAGRFVNFPFYDEATCLGAILRHRHGTAQRKPRHTVHWSRWVVLLFRSSGTTSRQ